MFAIIAAVLGGGIAAGTALYVLDTRLRARAARAAEEAARSLEEARQRIALAAKEEVVAAREQLQQQLTRREQSLDQKLSAVEQHDQELRRREQQLEQRTHALGQREQEIVVRLEQVAGLSAADAKQELVRRLEDTARDDAAALVRDIKEQAKKSADREAKKIVALAIQRIAAEQTAESSVAAIPLPSDELKGRIIGREGRNIRAFEAATGVDVIIDDTPDTVVVSCFDPVRREVGRLALERLIADGRLHPGRIEEIVNKAQADVDASIAEAGEPPAYGTGSPRLQPQLRKPVGGIKFPPSY